MRVGWMNETGYKEWNERMKSKMKEWKKSE